MARHTPTNGAEAVYQEEVYRFSNLHRCGQEKLVIDTGWLKGREHNEM